MGTCSSYSKSEEEEILFDLLLLFTIVKFPVKSQAHAMY